MDWNSKVVSWDFTDGDGAAAAGGGSGGIGSILGQGSFPDCSVDLKLGVFGELVQTNARKLPYAVLPGAATSAPSPAPVKRQRPGSSDALQNAACLVEGCKADLSKSRDYHRRHKVCEEHSKTTVVIVAGQEQRFCQQCSRFHLLVEFDEVKRSCRKRLDAHNMRRRKQQPEAMNTGSFFANYQGSRFPGYPQMFNASICEPKLTGIIKAEESSYDALCSPAFHAASSLHGHRDRKAFPFMDSNGGDTTMSESSGGSSSRKIMFGASGMSHHMTTPADSNCALSLLSSPAPTPAALLGQMVTGVAGAAPAPHPMVTELPFGAHSSSGGVSFTGFSCHNLVPQPGHAELDYQLYHVGSGGDPSPEEAMQHHPFNWY